MYKWVAALCATLYLTLLIFGAPPEDETLANIAPETPVATTFVALSPALENVPEEQPIPVVSQAPIAEIAVEPAVAVTPLPSTAPAIQAAAAPKPAPATPALQPKKPDTVAGEIWRVTGSRVNLRKAATTRASVVGQTKRGEQAEVLEMLDTGWARVFIIESGIEAYMSAKFISREG